MQHQLWVVGTFYLAQAGVAKVFFAVYVCYVGVLLQDVVDEHAVDGFACACYVVVGFLYMDVESVAVDFAKSEGCYLAVDAQYSAGLAEPGEVLHCGNALPLFVASHVVGAVVLAVAVGDKETCYLGYVVGGAAVVCITGLFGNELVVAVALLVECLALQRGKRLCRVDVVAPSFELCRGVPGQLLQYGCRHLFGYGSKVQCLAGLFAVCHE